MIGSNPSFTVSDFVAVFNQSLDALYLSVSITGELSNFRVSKGMWVYFDLKDEYASVKFFGTVRQLPGPLEDGMMVEVIGTPHLHEKFGFSVQVAYVQARGAGSINKAQKLLAEKLHKEGLFDESRKRPLPFPPKKIGLIASSESAAYGDFVKIIAARWPGLAIELYNVQVQGQDAVSQIVEAFASANQHPDTLETLVLVRGGGSKDDLAAFDHELVIRAVAASRIPTLVAIGHERDVCLSELAADMRASTPSNAAELLVPNRKDELGMLRIVSTRLDQALAGYSDVIKTEIKQYWLDLERAISISLTNAADHIYTMQRLFNAYDPAVPLNRGFTLARSKEGRIITSKDAASKESWFDLQFNDGSLKVTSKEIK